ncbi:hypothetical protein [Enterobacter phage 04_vB_Eclo_IJM]|nr:hypothetical protein [Enterobacter phage 04_vB_Eclo_IJM]
MVSPQEVIHELSVRSLPRGRLKRCSPRIRDRQSASSLHHLNMNHDIGL